MNNNAGKMAFVIVFLFVIYAIPMYQTISEYRTNANHRIQIFDLVEDIFVTPMKKENADADTIASLVKIVDSLKISLKSAAVDSQGIWDSQEAERLLDEALIRVRLLKASVIDYNRHIKGEESDYIHTDMATPYFKNLTAALAGVKGAIEQVQAGDAPEQIVVTADSLTSLFTEAGRLHPRVSIKDYHKLTLKALSRTMIGDKYLRPYEKEMEKVSMFANGIRPKMLLAYYWLVGDLGDKGIPGRHGWFFYTPDVQYLSKFDIYAKESKIVDPNDRPIRDDVIDTIVSFKKQLAEKGVDLLVVIMPGKPSIYPDLLNPRMKPEQAGKFTHSLKILDKLREADVNVVDLFEAFAQERKNDAEAKDSIYLRTDTHFRNRGVIATAKAVADKVKQYPWYQQGTTEYVLETVTVPRHGDIADMTKLPNMGIRDLKFAFPVEQTTCVQVYQVARDESGNETGRALYRDDYRNSQVLVLGDSFSRIYQTDLPKSAGWISHLAYELGQPVASIVNDGGASTLVREMLARKLNVLKGKKLVVWEIVERDLRFGEKGWKDLKLDEIAAAEASK